MSLLFGLLGFGGVTGIAGLALHLLAPSLFKDILGSAGSLKWKIAGIAGCAAAAVLFFMLIVAKTDNGHLTKENNRLDALINDPKTGYAVKLAQSETNVVTLQGAVQTQTDALKKQSAADAAALAAAQQALAAQQAMTRKAQQQSDQILSRPLQGTTVGDRCEDADRRLLETLK